MVHLSRYSPGGRRPLGRRCARPSASTGSCTRERRGSFISACTFGCKVCRRGSANPEPARRLQKELLLTCQQLMHVCMHSKAGAPTTQRDGTLCCQLPHDSQPQAMGAGRRSQAVNQRSKAKGHPASKHKLQAAHHGPPPSSLAEALSFHCRPHSAWWSFQVSTSMPSSTG